MNLRVRMVTWESAMIAEECLSRPRNQRWIKETIVSALKMVEESDCSVNWSSTTSTRFADCQSVALASKSWRLF